MIVRMSQNIQGFQEAQQRLQQQNNNNEVPANAAATQQQQSSAAPVPQQAAPALQNSGITPAMLLPNQPFGALLQPGGSATSAPADGSATQGGYDINNELKLLQQLQQLNAPAPANNALLFPGSNSQLNQPQAPNQAQLLQSMLDQQKMQSNNLMGGAAGFNNPLFQQPGLLQDARLLLAQSQMSGFVPPQASNQPEVPLPSPHSLFHRDGTRRMRGGVIEPFPEKLHRLLTEVEAAGRTDVISFVANGRAFAIHKPDKFFKEIVPLYFRQSRLSSFKRQLNLYGFELINTGPSRGGYFHELFVKDRPELCRRMRRVAVKVAAGKTDKDDGDSQGDEPAGGSDAIDSTGDGETGKLPAQGDGDKQNNGSGGPDE